MMRPLLLGLATAAAVLVLIAAVPGIEGETEDAGSAPEAAEQATSSDGEIAKGRVLFARMGCGGCHALAAAGSRGQIGPELSGRLGGHTRESLVAVISNPPANTIMPSDFADRMTPGELEALAAFLIAARGG